MSLKDNIKNTSSKRLFAQNGLFGRTDDLESCQYRNVCSLALRDERDYTYALTKQARESMCHTGRKQPPKTSAGEICSAYALFRVIEEMGGPFYERFINEPLRIRIVSPEG